MICKRNTKCSLKSEEKELSDNYPVFVSTEEEVTEMEESEESVDTNKFENDDRKLFVGGLTWETTVDQLKTYFEQYGTVKVRYAPAWAAAKK